MIVSACHGQSNLSSRASNGLPSKNTIPHSTIRSREYEDQRNHGCSCCSSPMCCVYRTSDRPSNEGAKHTRERGQHHRSTPELVDNVGSPESEAHVPHCQAAVDDGLGSRVCDTYAAQYDSQVVYIWCQFGFLLRLRASRLTSSQCSPRSLRSNSTSHTDPSPMTIAFCANKIEPTPTAVFFLESKCMLDLAKLKSGEFVVLITAAMVCAEYVQRFLVAASGDEPSYVK